MNKLFFIVFVIALPVNAGVYKWTDSQGNVHFGDRPSNESTATEITINTNSNTGVTNSSGNKKERAYLLESIKEKKEEKAKKRQKQVAANNKRKKQCNSYKRRYQIHIQSNRSYKMSPDGDRTYLDNNQRAALIKKLKKGVSKYCR